MFKYNKACSFLCLFVYLLVSTNCAPWLIYKSGEILFGIVNSEYACKGGNCGCDSAFKCLTDCCCEKVRINGKTAATCTIENAMTCCSSSEQETESCCSEDTESCCSEEKISKDLTIKKSGCSSDLSESLAETRSSHLFLIPPQSKILTYVKSNIWMTHSDLYSFEFYSEVSKVPIS